ncbi:MAG TPA: TolC family protein [Pirellulales bacterium]|nr:TolC family protein [Pirellulales bacterium]
MIKPVLRRSCWVGVTMAGFWAVATLAAAGSPRTRFVQAPIKENAAGQEAPTQEAPEATTPSESIPKGEASGDSADSDSRGGDSGDAASIEAGEMNPQPALAASPESILPTEVTPIDLTNALRLAGVQNPELQIARQRVVESAAIRMYMAAQLLPNLNGGMNYDDHTGTLQQSTGKIINLTRSALYVGAGANAIAAGTVNIPGVQWNLNVSNTIFNILVARQNVRQRQFDSLAVRNQVLGRVADAYVELLRTAGHLAVAVRVRAETRKVAHLTRAYAIAGEGLQSDADRAATELQKRSNDILQAESEVLQASAKLCQLLNLDPSNRLQPTDGWVVPAPIVPSPVPLRELVALGMLRRPELAAQRAAIEQALLQLRNQRVLPFSPNILIGFSGGTFGGGSSLITQTQQPAFGSFASRSDIDTLAYWTLQNLGVGNRAQINAARARLGIRNFEQLAVLNQVRMEVADAYARSHARYAQIDTAELAVRSSTRGLAADMLRIENKEGLPIEVLDNVRLLARARYEYLNAITDYNAAEFDLYVALGQPPANALARPVPPPADIIRGAGGPLGEPRTDGGGQPPGSNGPGGGPQPNDSASNNGPRTSDGGQQMSNNGRQTRNNGRQTRNNGQQVSQKRPIDERGFLGRVLRR